MIAGMDNLSLLAAQPLPIYSSTCAGFWVGVGGGRINRHIICSNFIFSLLGWLVIIVITVIITHLALVVFVVHERIFSCRVVPSDGVAASQLFRSLVTLCDDTAAGTPIPRCFSVPVRSFYFTDSQMPNVYFGNKR